MGWNSTIERTPQSDNDGVLLRQQNSQHSTFDGRMKSADDNPIGVGYFMRPASSKIKCFGWRRTRGEEGHQIPLQQFPISG